MRRALPLFALIVVGCGGTNDRTATPSPFFRVATTDLPNQDLSYGFDALGEPVAILYDETTASATVRTLEGARTISLKGRSVIFGLGVQGDFAYFVTEDETSSLGGFLVDTTTGEIHEDLGAWGPNDGNLYVTGELGAFETIDLKTGATTPLPAPADHGVSFLHNGWAVFAKDEGEIPGGPPIIDLGLVRKQRRARGIESRDSGIVHYASYRLGRASGGTPVQLVVPEGMTYIAVHSLNSQGEAAGLAYPAFVGKPPVVVRWSPEGIPTIVGQGTDGYQEVSISDDGRVRWYDYNETVWEARNGKPCRLNLRLNRDLGGEVSFSPDGKRAWVYEHGYVKAVATMFRLP